MSTITIDGVEWVENASGLLTPKPTLAELLDEPPEVGDVMAFTAHAYMGVSIADEVVWECVQDDGTVRRGCTEHGEGECSCWEGGT